MQIAFTNYDFHVKNSREDGKPLLYIIVPSFRLAGITGFISYLFVHTIP